MKLTLLIEKVTLYEKQYKIIFFSTKVGFNRCLFYIKKYALGKKYLFSLKKKKKRGVKFIGIMLLM